jgi:hypothetical protein
MSPADMVSNCLVRMHIQNEHPGFESWTAQDFREQFPGLVMRDGEFAYKVLDELLHSSDELLLIWVQVQVRWI